MILAVLNVRGISETEKTEQTEGEVVRGSFDNENMGSILQ